MPVKSIEIQDGIMTVSLKGSITKPSIGPLPGIAKVREEKITGVILDLSAVDFINSMGISFILDNYRHLQTLKVPIILCSARTHVLKVLRLSRTDSFIPVVRDYYVAKKMLSAMTTGNAKPRREHLLIIQHDFNVRSGLKSALKEAKQDANYVICTALNMDKAWEFLESFPFNIIIIDVSCPSDTVQKFIEKVRLDKRKNGIPIFIASDNRNLYNASYHTRNGADDIMQLPFNQYSTPAHIRTGLALYNSWRTIVESINSFDRVPDYTVFAGAI